MLSSSFEEGGSHGNIQHEITPRGNDCASTLHTHPTAESGGLPDNGLPDSRLPDSGLPDPKLRPCATPNPQGMPQTAYPLCRSILRLPLLLYFNVSFSCSTFADDSESKANGTASHCSKGSELFVPSKGNDTSQSGGSGSGSGGSGGASSNLAAAAVNMSREVRGFEVWQDEWFPVRALQCEAGSPSGYRLDLCIESLLPGPVRADRVCVVYRRFEVGALMRKLTAAAALHDNPADHQASSASSGTSDTSSGAGSPIGRQEGQEQGIGAEYDYLESQSFVCTPESVLGAEGLLILPGKQRVPMVFRPPEVGEYRLDQVYITAGTLHFEACMLPSISADGRTVHSYGMSPPVYTPPTSTDALRPTTDERLPGSRQLSPRTAQLQRKFQHFYPREVNSSGVPVPGGQRGGSEPPTPPALSGPAGLSAADAEAAAAMQEHIASLGVSLLRDFLQQHRIVHVLPPADPLMLQLRVAPLVVRGQVDDAYLLARTGPHDLLEHGHIEVCSANSSAGACARRSVQLGGSIGGLGRTMSGLFRPSASMRGGFDALALLDPLGALHAQMQGGYSTAENNCRDGGYGFGDKSNRLCVGFIAEDAAAPLRSDQRRRQRKQELFSSEELLERAQLQAEAEAIASISTAASATGEVHGARDGVFRQNEDRQECTGLPPPSPAGAGSGLVPDGETSVRAALKPRLEVQDRERWAAHSYSLTALLRASRSVQAAMNSGSSTAVGGAAQAAQAAARAVAQDDQLLEVERVMVLDDGGSSDGDSHATRGQFSQHGLQHTSRNGAQLCHILSNRQLHLRIPFVVREGGGVEDDEREVSTVLGTEQQGVGLVAVISGVLVRSGCRIPLLQVVECPVHANLPLSVHLSMLSAAYEQSPSSLSASSPSAAPVELLVQSCVQNQSGREYSLCACSVSSMRDFLPRSEEGVGGVEPVILDGPGDIALGSEVEALFDSLAQAESGSRLSAPGAVDGPEAKQALNVVPLEAAEAYFGALRLRSVARTALTVSFYFARSDAEMQLLRLPPPVTPSEFPSVSAVGGAAAGGGDGGNTAGQEEEEGAGTDQNLAAAAALVHEQLARRLYRQRTFTVSAPIPAGLTVPSRPGPRLRLSAVPVRLPRPSPVPAGAVSQPRLLLQRGEVVVFRYSLTCTASHSSSSSVTGGSCGTSTPGPECGVRKYTAVAPHARAVRGGAAVGAATCATARSVLGLELSVRSCETAQWMFAGPSSRHLSCYEVTSTSTPESAASEPRSDPESESRSRPLNCVSVSFEVAMQLVPVQLGVYALPPLEVSKACASIYNLRIVPQSLKYGYNMFSIS